MHFFKRLSNRGPSSPLDRLARSVAVKEGATGRRAGGKPPRYRPGESALRLLGAMAVLVLALALASTALLWRIADQTASTGGDGGSKATAEPPSLPPARGGGSSTRVVAREFRSANKTLSKEIGTLGNRLVALGEGASLPDGLQRQLAFSTANLNLLAARARALPQAGRSLGRLDTAARRLTGMERKLSRVAGSTRRLKAVQLSLGRMSDDIGSLSDVAKNTDEMNTRMGQMNDQLTTLDAVDTEIRSLNSKMQSLADSQEQAVGAFTEGTAGMEEQLAKMTGLMADLNGQMAGMSETMTAMCRIFEELLGGETTCPEG